MWEASAKSARRVIESECIIQSVTQAYSEAKLI